MRQKEMGMIVGLDFSGVEMTPQEKMRLYSCLNENTLAFCERHYIGLHDFVDIAFEDS